MNEKTSRDKIITRCFKVPDFKALEKRDAEEGTAPDGGIRRLEGHAAVFDSMVNIANWFNEIIARGAFEGCDFTDVLLFVNHDASKIPLARSRRNNSNSTMQLSVDDIGLFMGANIDYANNSDAHNLYSAVSRGDISGMSFCFQVAEDNWDGLDTDMPTRTIVKIAKVFEVSAVNEPAYDLTDINARDKAALDNAKHMLESVRSQELESARAVEVLQLKNEILGKI